MATRIPALELPFELTSEIFILCLPLRRRVRPHRNRAPLNLAGTCSQWRAVAIATPQLWTSISLDFAGIPYYGLASLFGDAEVESVEDHSVALMDLWFTRAAGHRLSISLTCSGKQQLPEEFLATMGAYLAQWGRIELTMPTADLLALDKLTGSGPFPLLESLSMQATDIVEGLVSTFDANLVRYSPNLKALRLMDERLLDHITTFPPTLTALRICDSSTGVVTGETLSALIASLPHLLHLDIPYSALIWTNNFRVEATLKTLVVGGDSILYFLTVPTLQHLGVWLYHDVPVISFLSASKCHLTILSLGFSQYVLNKVVENVLFALPYLDTLHVWLPERGSTTTVRCCQVLHRADLVPQLRTLIITGRAPKPAYAEWVTLLQARRDTLVHAGLHMCALHKHERFAPPPPAHIEAQLAELAGGGMQVRITTPTYARPWHAEEEDPVGDFDVEAYNWHTMRPHSFSPF
ncbi:F-box domain-containing protein [Mycena sanguinolenta]|uniref:F-box domain-containing protein n=1 Tax=Mycena sanguinolenta TaxID=230812 RepID=A0A8H6YCU0_9AGAR|nr:F-box domain-containing protein [Mycena sanguinolenta]